MNVDVRMLGTFEVNVDGRRIENTAWRSRKARSLVKMLCLAPNNRLHREQAMELLWADLDPVAAANNLRSAIHAARRALEPDRRAGGGSLVRNESGMIGWRDDVPLRVDVLEFERAATAAARARTPESMQHAIDLFGGELLPEDRYEDWVQSRRASVRDLAASLFVELATMHTERRPREAIALLTRALELDAAHEPAHVALMRLHASVGDRRLAVLQFERLRAILQEELGVEPAPASRQAYAEVLGGRAAHAPRAAETASQSVEAHLPDPLTSFVGRAREIESVRTALAQTRLLTLVGPGGSGKTRLALQVARACAPSFDAVWFVDLAPVADPSLVPQTVATVIGVREQPERTPFEALSDRIGAASSLFVLDNCEHLVEACSSFVDEVLGSCARVVILATSRAALRAPGEVTWRVPLLDVPGDRTSSTEEIAASGAVQLFVDRARLVQPGFELTDENARGISTICRRLDGLPLAIELAAARVGAISIDDLASRLGNALHVLKTGNRTAERRQRTLRSTMQWSFDLLDAGERRLLERSSVFRGGWTLAAIEEVASDELVPRSDVLDVLAALVDKSLVQTTLDAPAGPRYRMLEPVRQFAAEQHELRSDGASTHARHAAWFLALADAAAGGLHGAEQVLWLARLDAEHDNLRAALEWAFANDMHVAVPLAAQLWRFWYVRGHFREGRGWVERALVGAGSLPPQLRVRALLAAGQMRIVQAEYEEGRAILEEALAVMRTFDDGAPEMPDALATLAMSLYNRGEFVQARAYLEEGLELERRARNRWGISRCLSNLAEMTFAQGDHATSERYWNECLAIDLALGDTRGVAIVLHNLGEVLRVRGDLAGARERYAESLAYCRDIEFVLGTAGSSTNLAEVMLEQHDELAPAVLAEALDVARALGHPVLTATLIEVVGKLAALRNEFPAAARLFGAADALRHATGAHLSPLERQKIEPWLTDALDSPDPAIRGAWAHGSSLRPEALLDEAAALIAAADEKAVPPAAGHVAELSRLTAREHEIVDLIRSRHTNREIGARLGISKATADKHVANILRKLGVASRGEVAERTT